MWKYLISSLVASLVSGQNCAICWDGSEATIQDGACSCPAASIVVDTTPTENNQDSFTAPTCSNEEASACNSQNGFFDYITCQCALPPAIPEEDEKENIEPSDIPIEEIQTEEDNINDESLVIYDSYQKSFSDFGKLSLAMSIIAIAAEGQVRIGDRRNGRNDDDTDDDDDTADDADTDDDTADDAGDDTADDDADASARLRKGRGGRGGSGDPFSTEAFTTYAMDSNTEFWSASAFLWTVYRLSGKGSSVFKFWLKSTNTQIFFVIAMYLAVPISALVQGDGINYPVWGGAFASFLYGTKKFIGYRSDVQNYLDSEQISEAQL